MSRKNNVSAWVLGALSGLLMSTPQAQATEPALGFVGKNEWLFYRVEYSTAADQAATNTSMDLIRRFNKLLERNGIAMAFVMVPLKVRIYSEYLPEDAKINPYMAENYDFMARTLRAGQVNVIDLNTPFMTSPKRNSDMPFFFRLDTHWSPAGAMLAGQTIRAGIEANPALKTALDAVPEVRYDLHEGARKVDSISRGLIGLLPEGAPTFAPEQEIQFTAERRASRSLLEGGADAGVTLMGSSYSAPWYRLPDALRYMLQRDVLAISIEATHGSWNGMETYLRDDSFQTNKPRLLIWEMPERDMRMPPNYKFREARYHSDNTEWLLRVAAWVQGSCTPSPLQGNIAAGTLAASSADTVVAEKTVAGDFIELSFDKPTEKLDYLVATVATSGSKKLMMEASGVGSEIRRFEVPVPGDGAKHPLKMPLPSSGKGYTTLRIFPGKSSGFTFAGLQMCRHPADLLE